MSNPQTTPERIYTLLRDHAALLEHGIPAKETLAPLLRRAAKEIEDLEDALVAESDNNAVLANDR